MKKIALIANADSFWTKKYIENILSDGEFKIDIFSISNKIYSSYYEENNITVYTEDKLTWLSVRWMVGIIKRTQGLAKKSDKIYDIIQVHFVNEYHALVFKYLSRKNRNAYTIWTYWGSDLFRIPMKQLRRIGGILKKVDAVTFVTQNLQDKFFQTYRWDKKNEIIDFGVSVYDEILRIEKQENAKAACKRNYQFPVDKICVMAGYNFSEGQQHKKIIEAIGKMQQSLKDRLHVIFHFSYGNASEQYKSELLELTEREGLSYSVVEHFLNDVEMAKLRIATDIFIHGQTTDALSASMLESLFSGSIVLNGKWLVYKELEERGIKDIKFDTFDELSGKMEDIVEHFDVYKEKFMPNREILYHMNSWQALKSKWLDLLECGKGGDD